MTEVVEREESKKTVVAFITGLLIGGLLVWVFSSTPAQEKVDEIADDVDGLVDDEDEVGDENNNDDADDESDSNGDMVSNQAAGNAVVLGSTDFPTETGWVVVRDFANGTQGKILGAVRYDTEAGLLPTSVPLLRPTVKGQTYLLMYYSSEGTIGFKSGEDKALDVEGTTFVAN